MLVHVADLFILSLNLMVQFYKPLPLKHVKQWHFGQFFREMAVDVLDKYSLNLVLCTF